MIVAINNVEAIGLKEAQGLVVVNPFYWDFNDATRAWAKRFLERHPRKNFPNDMQAGVYAAVLHYLKMPRSSMAMSKMGAVSLRR